MTRTPIHARVPLVAAALLTLLSFGCGETGDPSPKATTPRPAAKPAEPGSVGSRLPQYTAVALDGGEFDPAKERQNVLLLNVWATWCGPCRYEIPELEQLHREQAGRGLKVVGVSVDDTGAESVREFVSGQKMTYPVVLDPEGKLATILRTDVLPTTVLVDRNGTIVWKKIGVVSTKDAELMRALETALRNG